MQRIKTGAGAGGRDHVDVSVVIVSYNTADFLRGCLDSIFGQEHETRLEVFVVDNASVDGSADLVRSEYRQVLLIANKENVGFARANNRAIRESRARYVLLLNPDAELLPGALDGMVRFMDGHPEAGAVGTRTWLDREKTLVTCGNHMFSPGAAVWQFTALGDIFPNNSVFRRDWESDWEAVGCEDYCEVEVLSGHCLLVRRDTIVHVGPLDENYFLFFEETDWCLRMKRAGWRLYYLASAGTIHYVSRSDPGGDTSVGILFSSMEYFLRKHFGRARYALLRLGFLAHKAAVRLARTVGKSIERSPALVERRTIEVTDGRIEGDRIIRWQKLQGVSEYIFELSQSRHFIKKALLRTPRTEFRLPDFFFREWPDATYYWRVAPLDREGRPGDFVMGSVTKRLRAGCEAGSRGSENG